MPQHQDGEAFRGHRQEPGVGHPGRDHQGPSRPPQPRSHAAPSGHSGVRARPRRGQSHQAPPPRLRRVQRGLRRRPDGGARAAVHRVAGRGAHTHAVHQQHTQTLRRQAYRLSDAGHGHRLVLSHHHPSRRQGRRQMFQLLRRGGHGVSGRRRHAAVFGVDPHSVHPRGRYAGHEDAAHHSRPLHLQLQPAAGSAVRQPPRSQERGAARTRRHTRHQRLHRREAVRGARGRAAR